MKKVSNYYHKNLENFFLLLANLPTNIKKEAVALAYK
jgi:hypothetical protein